jgi:hypothetical protein
VAGMGPGGPPAPKGYNENRENLGGPPSREKFYTDQYGERNRMSSMQMGKPSLDDGMPNSRGSAGPGVGTNGAGVNWLSSQN